MAYKKSAEEEAAAYLARRMRTEAEVRAHLSAKEYSADEIEATISDFKAHRYIDDYEYAMQFIEYGYSRDHAGKRIMRELIERGVSAETAGFAHEDYLYEHKVDEYSVAREHAEKMFLNATEGKNEYDLDKIKARIARNLSGRGFRSSEIYRILEGLGDKED